MAGAVIPRDTGIVPVFYNKAVENPVKTREAGRPIFEDVEFVEYHIAGDTRNFQPHFLAHELHERVDGEDITHAMRWPEEYARFKQTGQNIASGTPLEELTFLSDARRSELKALRIYTVEALAGLDGANLRSLAGDGYRFKEMAQDYIEKANGAAGFAQFRGQLEQQAAEIERLKGLLGNGAKGDTVEDFVDPYGAFDDSALKDQIEAITQTRPRGNPSRKTLVGMLEELRAEIATP